MYRNANKKNLNNHNEKKKKKKSNHKQTKGTIADTLCMILYTYSRRVGILNY